jgi:hypothetical protein
VRVETVTLTLSPAAPLPDSPSAAAAVSSAEVIPSMRTVCIPRACPLCRFFRESSKKIISSPDTPKSCSRSSKASRSGYQRKEKGEARPWGGEGGGGGRDLAVVLQEICAIDFLEMILDSKSNQSLSRFPLSTICENNFSLRETREHLTQLLVWGEEGFHPPAVVSPVFISIKDKATLAKPFVGLVVLLEEWSPNFFSRDISGH